MTIEERLGRQHESEIAIVDKMNPDFPTDEGVLRYEDTPDGLNIKEITSESNDFARQRDYIEALAAYVLKKAIDEKRTILIDTTIDGGSEFLRVLQNVPFADIVDAPNGVSTIKFNLSGKTAAPSVRLSNVEINAILERYKGEKTAITKALNNVVLALKEGNRPALIKAGKVLQQLAEGHPEVPGYMELVRQGRLLQAIPDEYLNLSSMFKEKTAPNDLTDAINKAMKDIEQITKPEEPKPGSLRRAEEKIKKEETKRKLDEWKKQTEPEEPKPEKKRTQVITTTKTELQVDIEALLKQVEDVLQKESETKPETKVDIDALLKEVEKKIKEKEEVKPMPKVLTQAEIDALLKEARLKIKEKESILVIPDPLTKPITEPKTTTKTQTVVEPKTVTKTQSKPSPLTYPETEAKPYPYTQPFPLTMPKEKEQEATKVLVSPVSQVKPQPQIEPQAKPEVKPQTKTKTQTKTETQTKTITKTPIMVKTIVIPPIIIKSKEGVSRELAQKEIDGAVAWKQGFMYILIWPPYGSADIMHSRRPIPGVKYYKGIGSAAASIVTKYGDIPAHIKRDMGIVDIDIFRGLDKNKPRIRFTADKKQKTNYTGIHTTGDIIL
jgi:hypothetical protein